MNGVEPRTSAVGGCPFLRLSCFGKAHCEAAINFGLEFGGCRHLCGDCQVPQLVAAPHCSHLDVYAYLYVARGQEQCWRVGALRLCGLDNAVVEAEECQACSRWEMCAATA